MQGIHGIIVRCSKFDTKTIEFPQYPLNVGVEEPLVERKRVNIVIRLVVQLAGMWMMFMYDRYYSLRCRINTVNY